MYIVCKLCEGLLDHAPPGEKDEEVSVCSARCGHVFHTRCLRKIWDTTKKMVRREVTDPLTGISHQVKVEIGPCPTCGFEYRPAVFEMFPSRREATFIAEEGEGESDDVILLRRDLREKTAKRDELKIKVEKQDLEISQARETIKKLEDSQRAVLMERARALKELEKINPGKLDRFSSEIFCSTSKNTNDELNYSSFDMFLTDMSKPKRKLIRKHSGKTKNVNVGLKSEENQDSSSRDSRIGLSCTLRPRKRVCYKQ